MDILIAGGGIMPEVFPTFFEKTLPGVPCVLRCGWQLGVEYCDDDPPELLPDVVRMSLGRRSPAESHCSHGAKKLVGENRKWGFLKMVPSHHRFPQVSTGFHRFPQVSTGFHRFPLVSILSHGSWFDGGPLRSNHCSLMNRLMATLGAWWGFMGGCKAPTIGYKWGYH